MTRHCFCTLARIMLRDAHTIGSLTADSDNTQTRFWVHINQLVELFSKLVSDVCWDNQGRRESRRNRSESIRPVLGLLGRGGIAHLQPVRPNWSLVDPFRKKTESVCDMRRSGENPTHKRHTKISKSVPDPKQT